MDTREIATDVDPQETQEWLEALDSVLERIGLALALLAQQQQVLHLFSYALSSIGGSVRTARAIKMIAFITQ